MTPTDKIIVDILASQEGFEQMVKARLRKAVRIALVSVLEEEVTAFGARPYERSQERRDQRNGHDTRDLETTVGQIADLPVPRTRAGYQTQLFERYHRRDDLDGAITEMFVKGVSTAKGGKSKLLRWLVSLIQLSMRRKFPQFLHLTHEFLVP